MMYDPRTGLPIDTEASLGANMTAEELAQLAGRAPMMGGGRTQMRQAPTVEFGNVPKGALGAAMTPDEKSALIKALRGL
jgi:hypothetical protein